MDHDMTQDKDPNLTKSAGKPTSSDLQRQPRFGVAVSVLIDGSMDGVLTLPTSIYNEKQCEDFLLKVGMKLSNPNEDWTTWPPEEQSFAQLVLGLGMNLLQSGMKFKILRTFTPTELVDVMKAYERSVI